MNTATQSPDDDETPEYPLPSPTDPLSHSHALIDPDEQPPDNEDQIKPNADEEPDSR